MGEERERGRSGEHSSAECLLDDNSQDYENIWNNR